MVRSYPQVLASADVAASGVFQTVHDEFGGEVLLPGLPFQMGDAACGAAAPRVPRLGEHTAEVLAEAGLAAQEVRRLQELGIVGNLADPVAV
ncbi:hypothetical protein D9M69_722400 [compost metagenome]